jgi:hypothetical protein
MEAAILLLPEGLSQHDPGSQTRGCAKLGRRPWKLLHAAELPGMRSPRTASIQTPKAPPWAVHPPPLPRGWFRKYLQETGWLPKPAGLKGLLGPPLLRQVGSISHCLNTRTAPFTRGTQWDLLHTYGQYPRISREQLGAPSMLGSTVY